MKYLSLFFISVILISCKVDPKIAPIIDANELKEIAPSNWPKPVYNFANNPIKKEVFELGRALFYDPILSVDNTISCGTCHQQYAAFAHGDHNVSHGVNDLVGTRNTPSLFNLTWHPNFMHDGGINHIEVQPIGPIQNPIEMDLPFADALLRLRASSKYRKLFTAAYGSEEVTDSKMLKSMAQFMSLMYSVDSKFDFFKRNENNVSLTAQELSGYQLFLANCNTCHTEPLFSDFGFRNNGLSINPFVQDSGRAHITGLPQDRFKFKVPSLRNIALSAPYMHDGRYQTLEQCLDHYTNNVVNQINLDPLLAPSGLNLTAQDKADVIAFLKTLSDYKFINDTKFADPR